MDVASDRIIDGVSFQSDLICFDGANSAKLLKQQPMASDHLRVKPGFTQEASLLRRLGLLAHTHRDARLTTLFSQGCECSCMRELKIEA